MQKREITRRNTLLRCLNYLECLLKMDSKDQKGLEPLDGDTEDSFYELQEQCRIIREVIQDYECPEVIRAAAMWRDPAKWQREHMRDPRGAMEQAMKDLDNLPGEITGRCQLCGEQGKTLKALFIGDFAGYACQECRKQLEECTARKYVSASEESEPAE